LSKELYQVSTKMYQGQETSGAQQSPPQDDVVDAEYTEVKDEEGQ
jgi:hypothetical protein